MQLVNTAKFIVSHAIAAGVYFTLFLALPAALGFLAVIVLIIAGIITGDMGGPLFLPGVFIMGLIYALCIAALGALIFFVTGGIQLLRRKIKISFWIPVVLAFPVAFTILVLCRSGGIIISLAVSAAFCTYWLAFSCSEAIFRWLTGRFALPHFTSVK